MGTRTTSPESRRPTGQGSQATQFRKGQSGNPGGRPKGLTAYIKTLVGDNGERLAEFWALIAFADDAEVKKRLGTKTGPRLQDRMAAAEQLASRGFGRPTVLVDAELSGGIELTWLTDEKG
jgi:hypothetical protein